MLLEEEDMHRRIGMAQDDGDMAHMLQRELEREDGGYDHDSDGLVDRMGGLQTRGRDPYAAPSGLWPWLRCALRSLE